MAFVFEVAGYICGADEDEDDEIDFCGMPSDQIVEIAVRRDFLLLRLQELVDAETLEQAELAMRTMSKNSKGDERFLVRAGTVEIAKSSNHGAADSQAAASLLKKLKPYYEQHKLKELEKERRGNWGFFLSGL